MPQTFGQAGSEPYLETPGVEVWFQLNQVEHPFLGGGAALSLF
jgi:hypothetical protein